MAAFLDKFRFTRKPFRQPKEKEADVSETKKAKEPAAEIHQPASEDTGQAYRVLLRPLVTEKGARPGMPPALPLPGQWRRSMVFVRSK